MKSNSYIINALRDSNSSLPLSVCVSRIRELFKISDSSLSSWEVDMGRRDPILVHSRRVQCARPGFTPAAGHSMPP